MSNHRSIRPVERRALFRSPRMLRALTESLGLSVLVLLFFASGAEAACYMRLNMGALPLPHKIVDNSFHTTYGAGYKLTTHSACGWAVNWPIEIKVYVSGEWVKATKQATEIVNVAVSTPFFPGSPVAEYRGATTQTSCKYDPWQSFVARCPSWSGFWWFYGGTQGVSKQEKTKGGWNTSLIPWAGFDYRGPYPAIRAKLWFNPWYY
jgi:hypothetical protein